MSKKIKIMMLSDHPLSPSGVGTQTRYIIEGLLKTGKYSFVCLGGAIKHPDYKPQKMDEYGDDWIIWPVDGYGNPEIIRSLLRTHRPDVLWFMTDPRFYEWLWAMEDEIRPLVPMIYYHVWDNYPYPTFNSKYYDSTDVIASISRVTNDIVANVSPEVELHHIPHAVNSEIFQKIDPVLIKKFREEHFSNNNLDPDRFIFFWNNRNARRKQSGSLLFWFKEFLKAIGDETKASLVMHTDPRDAHGQDLNAILKHLDLTEGQVILSAQKVESEQLSILYNVADCTINVADAEGFGLATFESLSCETPIIVNMTGGLQEQVTDGENFFGIGIEPASKAVIGSQDVPFIYEDRVSQEQVVNAMLEMYNKTPEERAILGKAGGDYVRQNYNFEKFVTTWDELFTSVHERYGSWEGRKLYSPWKVKEVV